MCLAYRVKWKSELVPIKSACDTQEQKQCACTGWRTTEKCFLFYPQNPRNSERKNITCESIGAAGSTPLQGLGRMWEKRWWPYYICTYILKNYIIYLCNSNTIWSLYSLIHIFNIFTIIAAYIYSSIYIYIFIYTSIYIIKNIIIAVNTYIYIYVYIYWKYRSWILALLFPWQILEMRKLRSVFS